MKKVPEMMIRIAFVSLAAVCILAFSACGCQHQWQKADCLKSETCSVCDETQGEPLGHTPGALKEEIHTIDCTVTLTQCCSVCDAVIGTETTPLESLLGGDLFLFSPEEFMDRLVHIAGENGCDFSYKFGSNQGMLKADLTYGEYQVLFQFFRSDAATLDDDQMDFTEVWCVSMIHMGECPAEVCKFFWMAADPLLDADSALKLETELAVEFYNAAVAGGSMGYLTQNGLLHEMSCIPAGNLGLREDMYMYNIYASDFR